MKATITNKDKNVMTFTLSVLTLSVLVLGLTFGHSDPNPNVVHSMDVILSKKSNLEAPEEADYLAANNQIGGGDQKQQSRPTHKLSGPSQVAEGFSKQATPEQKKQQDKQVHTQLITAQTASRQALSVPKPDKEVTQKTTDQQMTPEQKMAKLQDEIAKKIEKYAKKPRSKYVSSNTKAYAYAPYINDWVRKIERTGDLNYPEQAKKKSFIGNVMLSVGINKDGSIHEIKIIKPSAHQFLDEAAKHIVQLAQPFDPLPVTEESVDVLYITRTWQFLPGHLLREK